MGKKWLLIVSAIFSLSAVAQDFSNKGKDFWVGYGSHCQMYNTNGTVNTTTGGSQEMVLYFATEALTNITVSIPALGYTQTYTNIAANTIFETPALPKTGANDARLTNEGSFGKGIHIVSDKPVVAYAHVYNGSISGATLLFPTNTLGKEYYSLNFDQFSNQTSSYCFFYVVATDTGTTTIEVTPSANTQTMTAGTTYTVNLTQGQVFNALGSISGNNGVDLTGSKVKSIASGNGGCKRIAVYSGSGKINIKCPTGAGAGSADNYMVQCFPKAAWGKNYLTVPTAGMPFNYYRIAVADPTTVVRVNGTVLAGLVNNFYYQLDPTNQPLQIQADKPIMVAQYITTRGFCGNNVGIPSTDGDPEVIYLSPVEQNIAKVLLNSTPRSAINSHFISVVIPNSGTAISSFRIRGLPPTGTFVTHPQNPNYAYLQQQVAVGSNTLESDSGFNAIAYGYGNAETYGYNAGTNIRDLLTFITPLNPLSISTDVTACTGTPFYFSVTLPKHPDSLTSLIWDYRGYAGMPNDTINAPLTADTTYLIGNTRVWRYKLPNTHTFSPAGVYPITITAGTLTSEGCGNSVIIDRDLYVYDPPTVGFKAVNNGCVTDSVAFTDTTTYPGITVPYKWYWNFGDGNISTLKNPKHLYATPGTYTVKFASVSNVGCLSDTATRTVTITAVPTAKFGMSSPICQGKPVTFSDSSFAAPPGVLAKWYWNFGDGFTVVRTNGSDTTHIYTAWNTSVTDSLQVETNTGCKSPVFFRTFTVHPNPVANFSLPAGVCLPWDSARFINTSTLVFPVGVDMAYQWTFGDPGSGSNDTSLLANPAHLYTNTGTYTIRLKATSVAGCVHDTTKTLSNIYAQAHAAFTVNAENCLTDTTRFTSSATGSGHAIVQYHWDFGDATTSTLQNPTHVYTTPGTKTIRHWVVTDKGCNSDTTTTTIVINPLPTAAFGFNRPACETKTITFTDASVANVGSLTTWAWDFGDGTTSAAQSPTHTFATAGSYTVTLRVTNSKGCVSNLLSQTVVINPQPQPGFINPEVCLSDAFAQFVDTSKIATGNIVSWAWNFGDPASGALNTSNVQNAQHRYNAVGNYTATLTVTSDSGCVATVAQSFTVNGDIPVSNFNPLSPATLCANDSVAIQDAATVNFGNVTKVEIYWDNANFPAVFETDDVPFPGKVYKHLYPNFQSPLTKTFTIRYRAYSGGTCVNDRLKTITVNAAPRVQFNNIPNICLDAAPYQITQASEVGGVPGSGVYSGPGVTPGGLFNPATTGPGTFSIRYTFTSATGGCVDTLSKTITVYQPPVANFGYSATTCEKRPITFTDSSTASVGNLTNWFWDFGDGTPVVMSTSNAPIAHTYAAWGNYTVTLTVVTSNGCASAPKTRAIAVKPRPRPDFSFPASVCLPNAVVAFTNNSSIADGTALTYRWNFGDPGSGTANTSLAVAPSHIYTNLGPFNVNLQATSVAGCVHDTTIVLDVIHPQPKADFTINKASVCIGDAVSFTDDSDGKDGTVTQWFWNFGDGGTSNVQNPTHLYSTVNNYSISLYIINSIGCNSDTVSKGFDVYPYPVISAGPDRVVLEGGSITLEATATGNDLQYLWSPGSFLNNNQVLKPVVSNIPNDMTYILRVTARGNCATTDEVFIKLLLAPKIPNTFTPNNDGINDFWLIDYLDTYPGNRVQVFSRTGQLVFESIGYGKPWDGTLKGKPLPFDTYYYIIEPGNGRKPMTGYVTLVK
jgi:gliding motility-associated-like protein